VSTYCANCGHHQSQHAEELFGSVCHGRLTGDDSISRPCDCAGYVADPDRANEPDWVGRRTV